MDALLAAEKAGWASLMESRGGDFYGALMTPEAVMILADGSILDRDAIIANLNDAPAWDDVNLSDERVVPAGSDAAALVYRARAIRRGQPAFEALMTSVYCRTGDTVRLSLYQQTALG